MTKNTSSIFQLDEDTRVEKTNGINTISSNPLFARLANENNGSAGRNEKKEKI